ncbi:cell envelope integrity protein TolA [Candidatus Rariloculus sp.]|uniref:cell envelope integrity protein TolA n=1 Tax=Candidatus Rariloculus sp. TaxID=3101265 RepID=UPI003D102D96
MSNLEEVEAHANMGLFFRQHPVAVALSATLHLAIAAVLTAGAWFSPQARVVSRQVAIEAMIVDEDLVEREMARLEELEREAILQQEHEEREAREAADRERERLAELQHEREAQERLRLEEEQQRQAQLREQRERDETEQREREATEQQRLAEMREQREREEREVREAAERERERLAELQRQREEEERLAAERRAEQERQRQEEERRRLQAEAEAREQAERERELQRLLAAEEERRRAEQAGLLGEYIRQIENRIQRNWIRPVTATADLECVVNVTQIPSGDVVDVRVGECNGDDAVVQSIERAVLRASPLPRPPQQILFERNLIVTFRPEV